MWIATADLTILPPSFSSYPASFHYLVIERLDALRFTMYIVKGEKVQTFLLKGLDVEEMPLEAAETIIEFRKVSRTSTTKLVMEKRALLFRLH